MRRLERLLFAATLTAALALLGKAGWLEAKALLAQQLIQAAWQRSLAGEPMARPWPWADTWPVARLTTPEHRHLYVLDSISGQALAFGPGQLRAGAAVGEPGTVVIAGHRDSHFRFLQHVRPGDGFSLQDRRGRETVYRVIHTRVVDSRRETLQLQHDHPELLLISCYPFNALPARGPLRFVVSARAVDGTGEKAVRIQVTAND